MAPVKKKNHNASGLGRSIINRKSKDARQAQESRLYTTDIGSGDRLRSVTQENDLDEFLNTAQLASTDFTAEKSNITIVQTPGAAATSAHNPFLLTAQEEREALEKHRQNRSRLRVPRRPPWHKDMTHVQIDRNERDAFLEWRRGLAQLQDDMGLMLTPFERNLEVWRQLWRVVERSQLVVQIVDARNPLRFRCEDLEEYVKDVEGAEGEQGTGKGKRRTLLLVNKADLLTVEQRLLWADYFEKEKIQFAFFSAAKAVAIQQARQTTQDQENNLVETGTENTDEKHIEASDDDESSDDVSESSDDMYFDTTEGIDVEPRAKVLSVSELEALFISSAPDLSDFTDASGKQANKLTVGLVGYPNVGKSSTINSLLGEKKVSVSSTPGKTKHFQTIHLSDSIILCDCPGLVFPQFTTTAAELVCDGVLPIDQLREYTGPVTLVVQRIRKEILEGIYGLQIRVKDQEDGGDGRITAEDLLVAYAIARGFARSGQGNPDEARAARYILKDYVNAKLLYCQHPPGFSETVFNDMTQSHALSRLTLKKRAPLTRVGKNADTFVEHEIAAITSEMLPQGQRARAVDESFFDSEHGLSSRPFVQGGALHGQAFSRTQSYPHQNSINDDGSAVIASSGGQVHGKGKKHFKGNKRVKQRSGRGYD